MQHQELQELKKKVIRKFFARMNPQQFDAVTTVDGAVLIIAGAGSGKTTVMIHRIANMILFGNALHEDSPVPDAKTIQKLQDYAENGVGISTEELRNSIAVNPVKPWQILAITFTNKAAEELKNRLSATLGEIASQIQASTFHSACVRILRTCSDRIGYDTHFTIYDTDDSLKLLKSCMKELKIPEKEYPPRDLLTQISQAKDKMLSPEEYTEFITTDLKPDPKKRMASRVYSHYQEKMQAANAMDFDDLIYLTVRVFEQNPDVLEKYQNRFQYFMVDEYQDTNFAQYRLISLLAGKYRNLCVVGDDDQSIYKFRGATIENILNFEQEFPDCKVIRLEENYRSTQNILKTANAVIAHNQNRKSKTLWTAGETGTLTHIVKIPDETREAQFIADQIRKSVAAGGNYADSAVLYRINAMSNNLEKVMIRNQIPYRIYGGIRFQDRKEVKDILAYLSLFVNDSDQIRFERIVNTPRRGIGESTIMKIIQTATAENMGFLEVMANCQNFPELRRKASTLLQFAYTMTELRKKLTELPLDEFFDSLLKLTGYQEMLEENGKENEENRERLENLQELRSSIVDYIRREEQPSLEGFLAEMALYTDADQASSGDVVSLMTIHAAKGLEFRNVFVAGMEENIFPSYRCLYDPSELEEERRLAYVAITRAKRDLYLFHADSRLLFGRNQYNTISRFIREIPKELKEIKNKKSGFHEIPEQSAGNSVKHSGLHPQASGIRNHPPSVGNLDLHFAVGERIHDEIFGDGEILRAEPTGNDYLLEIAFEKVGKKKLMARYRKITKI